MLVYCLPPFPSIYLLIIASTVTCVHVCNCWEETTVGRQYNLNVFIVISAHVSKHRTDVTPSDLEHNRHTTPESKFSHHVYKHNDD